MYQSCKKNKKNCLCTEKDQNIKDCLLVQVGLRKVECTNYNYSRCFMRKQAEARGFIDTGTRHNYRGEGT